MGHYQGKSILILGANSDVAKQMLLLYLVQGAIVTAASRSTESLTEFAEANHIADRVSIRYFDAVDFESHQQFYHSLSHKPHVVVYAAGYLVQNDEALQNWEATLRMMQVHYAGAVSILNLIAMDAENHHLERIIGLSSLSGVRGRKSNFLYGSTKAAFTTYLAGLRQELAERKVVVNVVISGYIRTKINEGLELNQSLIMEPEFVAGKIVRAGRKFKIVPGWKWKVIYLILRMLPEGLVAKLP